MDRRTMLGLTARSAATLVVSQSIVSCASNDTAAPDTAGTGTPTCVLTAALTEGPFFVDERLNRSDIRTDPATGAVSAGVALALSFRVSRTSAGACTPLTGAFLDVWHCDAAGAYSDVGGTLGRRFLRGYQVTDAAGTAAFTTIYPGWYAGRAVHVHFKLRLFAGATRTYEFTSQFFFNEAATDEVHAQAPYTARGRRNTLNTTDGIFNGLSSAQRRALTLATTRAASGYSGTIDLAVQVV